MIGRGSSKWISIIYQFIQEKTCKRNKEPHKITDLTWSGNKEVVGKVTAIESVDDGIMIKAKIIENMGDNL